MKIIFLDIDGVLNNYNDLSRGVHLDPNKVLRIKRICTCTGAKVVYSTSWRILYSVEVLNILLRRTGASNVGIDSTKSLPTIRGNEIKEWLERHPEVTDYVIIDDDDDMLDEQRPRFVNTDGKSGITDDDVDKAIQILGKLPNVCSDCSGMGSDEDNLICCRCFGRGVINKG